MASDRESISGIRHWKCNPNIYFPMSMYSVHSLCLHYAIFIKCAKCVMRFHLFYIVAHLIVLWTNNNIACGMNNRTPSISFLLAVYLYVCSFHSICMSCYQPNMQVQSVHTTPSSRKSKAQAVHIVVRVHAIWYSNWNFLKMGAGVQSVCVLCNVLPYFNAIEYDV